MNILTVDNITKSYGVRKIFDGASFFLQEGEKAGIIGINGTGKSTLLKMIAGLEEADDGTVIKANHCLVRYLPQNPEFAPEETVLEAVLRGNRMEENAGTIEADAKSMLTKLGVTEFDQPCGQLSGGQRKRLALVSVLLSPAEILLLDEPTNHLDNSMSDWLEDQLRRLGIPGHVVCRRLRTEISYDLRPGETVSLIARCGEKGTGRWLRALSRRTPEGVAEVLLAGGREGCSFGGKPCRSLPREGAWARDLNAAARAATGDYLLFLVQGVMPLERGWLTQLRMYAQRPDVACVGSLLMTPELTV